MEIRRVVTGHTGGKAVFASDTVMPGATVDLIPGMEYARLWGVDERPTYPDDGSAPEAHAYFPPRDGARVVIMTFPPDGTPPPSDLDGAAAFKQFEEVAPGLMEHMDRSSPGMHTTDTIDFGYVISGEIVLELDDGAEKTLKAGDLVVQNGTRHAWRNRTNEPVMMLFCLIGANRAG